MAHWQTPRMGHEYIYTHRIWAHRGRWVWPASTARIPRCGQSCGPGPARTCTSWASNGTRRRTCRTPRQTWRTPVGRRGPWLAPVWTRRTWTRTPGTGTAWRSCTPPSSGRRSARTPRSPPSTLVPCAPVASAPSRRVRLPRPGEPENTVWIIS